jgi:hypothetical protein
MVQFNQGCYLALLYHYLYRRLSNAHDAEDLTTQVLIDVLEGRSAHRDLLAQGSLYAHLYKTQFRNNNVDVTSPRPPGSRSMP